ncbi:MAG: DUF86 domain-containing protein [Deltaproteobacteria bacterium]|nr:DUF86 domain-containing protein [Deltaproteobacteria bacterium]
MSRDKEYVIDILEAAKLALSYVSGKTKDEFLKDTQCQDAVIRRLEIIGEAARRISDETRATYPKLPWKAMVGMRNVMIHEYDDVDLVIVWNTVQNDLPPVVARLEKVVPPHDEA